MQGPRDRGTEGTREQGNKGTRKRYRARANRAPSFPRLHVAPASRPAVTRTSPSAFERTPSFPRILRKGWEVRVYSLLATPCSLSSRSLGPLFPVSSPLEQIDRPREVGDANVAGERRVLALQG